MNPQPDRIEAIFAAAVAHPAEQRAAYLDQACDADAELRRRVEALLQAHDAAGSFLEKPAPAAGVTADLPAGQWIDRDAPPELAEGPGTRIGPYKLLQKIGEGGMGVVYMAEQQEPIRRMVALKIIKPGMDSAAVVARFEAERQALALMDHQNIARVFDGGTTSGEPGCVSARRPFFVMELVKGVPITRFCDENRLTPRERLELFVPVCEAVQHAHQKGVIHRDLKPSNVLVTLYDGRPVPKVIDFGVAKALHQKLTERTMFTAFGTVVGTLEYMSPEQAEMNALDVDTRSDVYSLGVLLYELLTGTTPLERERLRKAAYTEMLRLIREEEPLRPSMRISGSGQALARISSQRKTEPAQLARLVRGELDWIVMKSLEKDRSRRYETATGLARDVERYLKDEPVEACPPSVAYRLGKFARKYRVVLSTAAAFVLLLFIAAGVSSWLAVVAHRAEGDANEKRDEADNERDRADREAGQAKANAAEARKSLDRLSVEQGLRLAENDDLFTALLWFAKPLERGGLSPEEERTHRTRFACYLRHTHGRPVLRQMIFLEGMVRQMVFSPDATELLTSTAESAQVWDLNTGRKIAMLGGSKEVEQFRFPDASRLVGQDGLTIRTWDARTGELLDSRMMQSESIAQSFSFALPRSVWQALISSAICELMTTGSMDYRSTQRGTSSPDGRLHLRLVGNHVWLCDAVSGKVLHHWSFPGLDERIIVGEFSANVRRVLISTGKQVRVYDVRTGKPIGPALIPEGGIEHAQINADGSRVLLKSADSVALWDVVAGKRTSPAALGSADIWSPILSPDGRIAALPEGFGFPLDTRFALWDAEAGRLLAVQTDNRWTGPVRFSPDGYNVITAGKDRANQLWDVRAGRAAGPLLPNPDLQTDYEFSPDCRMLAVAQSDGIVRVWDLAGYMNRVRDVRSQAEEMPYAIAHLHCRYKNWVQTGDHWFGMHYHRIRWSKLRERLKALPAKVKDPDVFVALSPDSSRLVTVASDQTGHVGSTALLWDVTTGRLLCQPIKYPEALSHVEFSGDSRFLVTASAGGPAKLHNARRGELIGIALNHGVGVHRAGFSADGSRLVTCGVDGSAQIWDTATATPIGPRLRHAEPVNAAVFSPDGRHVATASSDGTARLWETATGQPVGRGMAHSSALLHIAFDSQGRLLVTQGLRRKLDDNQGSRIWDTATQQPVTPKIYAYGFANMHLGATLDAEGLFAPYAPGQQDGMKYDLRPDERPHEDLVKIARLHAGQQLDDRGNAGPLAKSELQKLWNELKAKYPDEFTVGPEAVRAWHLERIKLLGGDENAPRQAISPAIRLHREWLNRLDAKQP